LSRKVLSSRLGLSDSTSLELFGGKTGYLAEWNVAKVCALTRWPSDTVLEVTVKASDVKVAEDKGVETLHGKTQTRRARVDARPYILRTEKFFSEKGLHL
jgi:hypothetical protein